MFHPQTHNHNSVVVLVYLIFFLKCICFPNVLQKLFHRKRWVSCYKFKM